MASTYVNDLRLNELATGDGAGTWGTTTNTNLELIGEAFSFGTEAITTNADTHTTTIADGASDPGRSMYLKYTGTLDSACTITIGPNTVSKMWFIENGTSGSQNIIISQGSGANITIPPGDVKVIYSDGAGSGAAVVDAFASLSVVDLKVQDDLTVTDDMTVGGTLGVTGVLTATSLDISGDIDVDGTTNLDVVDIDGAVDMATTLAVAGNVDFNGDLDVDGTTNLDVVDIDGAVDFASTTAHAGNATFADNAKALFGTGSDLEIYHNGTNSFIADVGTGVLDIQTNGTEIQMTKGGAELMAKLVPDGAVTLYYDNAAKLATTSTGVQITGNITNASGDLTLDVAGDIILDADGGNVKLLDGGVVNLDIYKFGGHVYVENPTSDSDIIFSGNDGGSAISALTLDMSDAGTAIFNHDIVMGDSANIFMGNGYDLRLQSDGTNGIIYAANGDLTLDVAGDINLDADGADINLKDGGTAMGRLGLENGDLNIASSQQDYDIKFKGNDGGSVITALTLDMSNAGKAEFNAGATFNSNVAISTADNTDTLTLVSTDADANGGPILVFDRTSGSPANNDLIGQIEFQARNNAAQDVDYAGIDSYILDVTDGSEDGELTITTMVAGTTRNRLDFTNTQTIVNESGIDVNFRVESSGKTHMLFVDGGNDRVGIMNSAPATSLHIGDSSGSQQIRLESNGGGASIKGTDTVNNASSGYTVGHLNGTNRYELTIGTIPIFDMYKTAVIFNEGSVDMDFRVESNNNANMLFVDGGTDNVGIGTSTLTNSSGFYTLSINGSTGGQIAFQTNGTGKQYIYSSDTDLNMWNSIDGSLRFHTNNVERLEMSSAATIFNETGADVDFRVESNNVDVMLVVDGGNDKVGVGIVPAATLHVRENAGLNETAELLRLDCGSTTHVGGKGGKISFHDISVYTPTAEIIARREGVSGNSHLEFSLRDVVRLGLYSDGGFTTTPTDGGHAVFNQGSADADFRVESNSNTHMFYLDGGNDQIIIGSNVANANDSAFFDTNGILSIARTSGTGRTMMTFRNAGAAVGTISTTTSATTYSTSSDGRLKDVTGSARGLEVINELNPVAYNWKSSGQADEGLIAQEVLDIIPNAIHKNREEYYEMDYSKLVVHLVAGMKEQQTQIDALQSEINLLKGE